MILPGLPAALKAKERKQKVRGQFRGQKLVFTQSRHKARLSIPKIEAMPVLPQ
jgi:superfamily II helicase